MGSSSSSFWPLLAALCGLLYLMFDAARYLAQELGTVRMRGLAGEVEEAGGPKRNWRPYDIRNFQIVSATLLQLALIAGVAATIVTFASGYSIVAATVVAFTIWLPTVVVWKFVLALVPEEITELLMRTLMPISNVFFYALWPVFYPLRRLMDRYDALDEYDEDDEEPSDADVQAYIDVGEEEGILEPGEGKMLQSIVEFSDRMAREIMTPRIDVVAFDESGPVDGLARLFNESKYARLPLYRGTIDRITGIVHVKDLFEAILKKEQKSISEMARPPYFVSESKSVSELLREFQSEHIQIAVVVDEFGGTAGLVTIEDVIEELVGDIADEHEEEEPTIVEVADDSYLVSGLLRVEELDEKLGADLTGDDYETVAGLIFTTLGRVPNVGTVVKKNGWAFDVDRADRRRIYRVKITRDPEWEALREREGA